MAHSYVKNSKGKYDVYDDNGKVVYKNVKLSESDLALLTEKFPDKLFGSAKEYYAGASLEQTNKLHKDVTSEDYINSLIEDAYKNYANLNVDPNSAQSQQYMSDMYAAINREQSEVEAALSNAELDAYRQIGYQQQELENQIAENRLKALKSGTTSAQLAAQQLNNMFAAQAGASQIAANAMNARVGNAQEYASQRAAVTGGLYDQIAQNKTTLATAGAQNAAAGLSYASYVNQQLANLQANKSLYDIDPKGYNKIFNY